MDCFGETVVHSMIRTTRNKQEFKCKSIIKYS